MSIKSFFTALCFATPCFAQEPVFDAPDWLSESITRPHANVVQSASPTQITIMPIGAVSLDAVGILPASVTGLPANLWGDSSVETLANLMRAQPYEGLPAVLAFTQQLALAELDPPLNAGTEAELFLARLDLLLARGALEPARALMERAGPSSPQIFRRWFDVSLLSGDERRACATMRANPDIAPTFTARIFCLARTGDWSAAALSLGTGAALGFIAEDDAELIARFLDPDLFEDDGPLPPETNATPLRYQLRVALGERPPSSGLPLAFAHSDLSDVAGWRAQLDASERLLRSGAIPPSVWLDIYTDRVQAASGGVWDRVAALQRFDEALLAGEISAVTAALPHAWGAMRAAGLEVPFATVYAERLLRLPLTADAAMLARRIGLLSPRYELVAQRAVPQSPDEAFLFAIARGQSAQPPRQTATLMAISSAFSGTDIPSRYSWLLDRGRLGEALLLASRQLSKDNSDTDDLEDALRLFRMAGLEDIARRAALQLIILGSL
jgi:hypothetical protein